MNYQYKAGEVYIRRSDETAWILVSWGDVSVTLTNANGTEKLYPSHETFRKEFI